MKSILKVMPLGLCTAAVVSALLTTLPAAAGEVTACIGPGGAITAAAAGSTPLRKCPPNHVQQTWGLNNDGPPGPPGADGISCWDLDEDGEMDRREDFNGDGKADVLDCRPAEVYTGEPTERTWYVSSDALLDQQKIEPAGDHYLRVYETTQQCLKSGDFGDTDCLVDPIDDPCDLWEWEKEGKTWSIVAKQGYNSRTLSYQTFGFGTDGKAFVGWTECRDACLADAQCVGASVEAVDNTEDGMYCKLISKSQIPDLDNPFRNDAIGTEQDQAAIWQGRDSNFAVAVGGAIISVCPAP